MDKFLRAFNLAIGIKKLLGGIKAHVHCDETDYGCYIYIFPVDNTKRHQTVAQIKRDAGITGDLEKTYDHGYLTYKGVVEEGITVSVIYYGVCKITGYEPQTIAAQPEKVIQKPIYDCSEEQGEQREGL